MKNKRGMLTQLSDKAQVSFCDVVDSFSEEEWKLLQLWQKELYNNLMKELQQAFSSLGPFIATLVFSLKPKVKENTCTVNLQDLDTMDNVNLYSGGTASEADMIFVENEYLKDSPNACERGRLDVSNTDFVTEDELPNPGNIVRMEGNLEPAFVRQCDAGREEGRTHQTIVKYNKVDRLVKTGEITGGADMASAICFTIKSEEEMYSDFENSESIDSSTPTLRIYQLLDFLFTGLEVTAPVVSIDKNEVGEIYPICIQDDSRGESSNSHLGKGNLNRERNIRNVLSYNDKPRLRNTPSKNLKINVVRIANQNNFVSPAWPGNDGELKDDIKTQLQSGSHQQVDCSLQKTASHVQPTELYDSSESTVRTGKNVPREKSTRQRPESDQSCQKNSSTGHHQAPQSKAQYSKARNPCTECGKSFISMSCLMIHRRIHTGERPFLCTICGKRFTQKGDLHRHQPVHTGARPYQCNVCQKTFTQKCHLHRHKRIHIIPQKL